MFASSRTPSNDSSRKDSAGAARAKVIAFPWHGIAYTECLYAEAEKLGVEVIEGVWSGRWLNTHVRKNDVVHIHWPSFLYFDPTSTIRTLINLARFVAFVELIRLRGARIVWTAHNLYPHDGSRREWSHRAARRVIASRSNHVLAHGPIAAGIVAGEFKIPLEQIQVIQHGHWLEYHPHNAGRGESRARLNIEPHRFVYAFVGTCKPYKNLENLIEAFARQTDDTLLLIAGHFPSIEYRRRIEAQLERLPKHRWRLEANFIANEDIQHYVLAGDTLVLPYEEILTSGSAMLGLSFGRPVVAPDMGGLRNVIDEHCGILYDASQNEGLSTALDAVRSRTFSEQRILQHAGKFTWTSAAQALARLAGR